MSQHELKRNVSNSSSHNMAEGFLALSHEILLYANRGLPRIDFVREILRKLIDFSGCEEAELRLKRRQKYYRYEMSKNAETSFQLEYLPCLHTEDNRLLPCTSEDNGIESLCRMILSRKTYPSLPNFTKKGSFWTNEVKNSPLLGNCPQMKEWESLAVFPMVVDQDNIGLLHLRSKQKGFFTPEEIDFYEGLVQTLGVAFVHRTAQVSLRERVKELTCLYGIAQLVAQLDLSLEKMLQGIVKLLPPAWLYPDIATARIILDGFSYFAPNYQEGRHIQIADILVVGKRRGVVEVIYLEEKPELDDGPFLQEERSLINAVAREVALILERRQAEEEKVQLQNQLMHSDRLATIGQLAAGVAHELNEPLGNILGFAQLATKCPGLPSQALLDIEKIVNASLHAREVVKKLLIFARQMPTKKSKVNLNQIVEEGIYFFESRCAKEGIELVRLLSPNLPRITADAAQLQQVLVNLVVNSIQAMPQGGKLTLQTLADDGYVTLVVEDTGMGMSEEVQKQIFVPFYTTKEIGEGTGLGLSVVHGIVSSHGGKIEVRSKEGEGTRFEIKLPISEPLEEEEGQ
jgi:two-component system NtrC family sensor kinase